MNRRDFLRSATVVSAGLAFSKAEYVFARDVSSGTWRTFDVTTHVEVLKPSGTTRIWAPAALISPTPFPEDAFQHVRRAGRYCEAGQESNPNRSELFRRSFPLESRRPSRSQVGWQLRTLRSISPRPSKGHKANHAELEYFLQPTNFLPTDGIVKETAMQATKGANTDLEKARAIYEWIVENTYRNPKTRGCGLGDIRFLLETKDLGGKCADLNALYVGLARAAGLPARDAYGIRVAKSELGYKSLGASSEKITKSQHCRAEVYLHDYGWVPVDPADVRKVMLEEPPGNRPIDDDMVKKARARLFGSWEMNWMAFNFGHDVALPGSAGKPVPFLMYPQAETADGRLDPLGRGRVQVRDHVEGNHRRKA